VVILRTLLLALATFLSGCTFTLEKIPSFGRALTLVKSTRVVSGKYDKKFEGYEDIPVNIRTYVLSIGAGQWTLNVNLQNIRSVDSEENTERKESDSSQEPKKP
jgi:hypothetical protein